MIGFIWQAIIGGLWKPIAALLGVLGVYMAGSRNARQKAQNEGLRADQKAHERINNADLGLGATDDERVKRLREFADKHGK